MGSSSESSSAKKCLDDTEKEKVMKKLQLLESKAKYLKGRRESVEEERRSLLKTLVGREKEKKGIIDQLFFLSKRKDGASHVPVITITGLQGIGKTMLAVHVCEDEGVKNQFGSHALVTCSKYNAFDANSIVKQITDDKESPKPNMIVILDDWRVEITDQNVKDLRDKLKEGGRCVKAIMITTRNCVLAKTWNIVASSIALVVLDEKESLSLFKMIPGEGNADSNSISTRERVRKCRGVPLAIIKLAERLHSRNHSQQIEFMEELSFTYYPEGLHHQCFTYCSLFPQDYSFDAGRLIHLWMAEGFLEPTSAEDIARKYFREFVKRSIFEVVKKHEFGSREIYKMHPLMHDIATFVNDIERENINVDKNGEKVHHKVQRASVNLDFDIPSSFFDKAKDLKSIIFFHISRAEVPSKKLNKYLENIFKSLKKLCVLDLRDLGMKKVPESIEVLKELQYLDLSMNEMEKLPSSLAKLSNLKTLKLFMCSKLKELPQKFENLTKLRHLDMEGCVALSGMPRLLTSLQTLSAFVASKNKPAGGLEELANLNELRGDLIISKLNLVAEPLEGKCLENKQHLQRLTLLWDPEEKKAIRQDQQLALLNSLKPSSEVGELILNHYGGPALSGWLFTNPITRLVKLSLLNCVTIKYISETDQLPELKILQLKWLDNLEFVAKYCDKDAAFYQKLQELTISGCPKLKSWWEINVEVNDRPLFASISKLHVLKCPQLTCIPFHPRSDMLKPDSTMFSAEFIFENTKLKLQG